jgi:hypothetical protein
MFVVGLPAVPSAFLAHAFQVDLADAFIPSENRHPLIVGE